MKKSLILFFLCYVNYGTFAQQKLQHISSGNNTRSNSTYINAEGLNNNPNAIIIVEYDETTRAANQHAIGVWYNGTQWAIFNQDRATMPAGLTFNLTWKNADDKSFVFRSNNGNTQLDHPLINNNPSARFFASQVWNPGGSGGVYNNSEITLGYNAETGKWILKNTSGNALPAGAAFNILIENNKSPLTVITTLPATINIKDLRKDSIRFRVTINGFTCTTPTADHILEVDGKGDEIFAGGVTQYYNTITGEKAGTAQRRWTLRAGDVNSDDAKWGMRVRAGSKPGGMGGIQNGDQFPAPEPWRRRAPVYKNTFPLLLTEGVLVKGENAAMIVPSIWEYDGTTEEEQQLNNFASTFAQIAIFLGTQIPTAIITGGASIPFVTSLNIAALKESRKSVSQQPVDNLNMFAKLDYQLPEFNVIVSKTLFGDAKDRPIGMNDKEGHFDYTPIGMYLNYDNAKALSSSDFGFGPGILPLRFKDPSGMQGDYTIYLQIDIIDGKQKFTNPDEVSPLGENNNYGWYKMTNVYSNEYLGAEANSAFGNIYSDVSEWQFEKVPGAHNVWYYYLVSRGGRYLAVPENDASKNINGYAPVVSNKQAKSTHYWRVISNSDGTYSLLNVYAQKALVQDGPSKRIMLWENRANPEQRWKITYR